MTAFNDSLYQDFVNRDELQLYNELYSTYDELIARKVTRIAYPEDARTSSKSRVRFNCRVCQQALLHRALYLFEGSLNALSNENAYALVLCVRGHYEGTATLGYQHKRITSYIEEGITLDDFDQDVYRQILGSKHETLPQAPDPKNIMTQLDYADRIVHRVILQSEGSHKKILRECYEFLSEFCHPNFHSYSLAFQVDKTTDSFVFRYDHPLKKEEFTLIGYLSISNVIFVQLFDSFGHCIEEI